MEEISLEKILKDCNSKFCKHCGRVIPKEMVICVKCGYQVEEIKSNNQPQVVINNTNTTATYGRKKNKWIAFILCLLFGSFGAHKFYEGKVGIGIVYLFTAGLFGIGWAIDCIILLFKSNPYYV